MSEFAILSTTLANPAEARAMAHALVEAKLAACVQIVPITSVYRWDEKIEEAGEQLLLCKIVAADFATVEAAIRARHGYDVPEIVMTPLTKGHGPYLDWLRASVAR